MLSTGVPGAAIALAAGQKGDSDASIVSSAE